LTLALLLLPSFALALFIGTLLEGRHDRAMAQALVYRSWWFQGFLALLFVNILLAALKKWPWKRHQLGFLVTHLGLLTLIVGGLLTTLGGMDGAMYLVDSSEPAAAGQGVQTGSLFMDHASPVLRIRKAGQQVEQILPFAPGPLPWGQEATAQPSVDTLTRLLAALAHPRLGPVRYDLGEQVRLEVLEFLPHAVEVPFQSPAFGEPGVPALSLQLAAPDVGPLPERWVGYADGHRQVALGPALVEFLARECNAAQLAEFRSPPDRKAYPRGQLVIGLGSETHRIDLAAPREEVKLGSGGWRLRIQEYLPNRANPSDSRPADPAVSFELTSPAGRRYGLATTARRAGDIHPLPGYRADLAGLASVWVWLHPPDPAYGNSQLRGVLQFASSAEGVLWHRSWSTRGGAAAGDALGCEGAGRTALDGSQERIWSGMGWRFRVREYLPQAVARVSYRPNRGEPRTAVEGGVPAIRCRLTNGLESRDFWLGLTDADTTPVSLGPHSFRIGLNPTIHELPFTLTLIKAEERSEGGKAGPQASWVLLDDPSLGRSAELRCVTLNSPLVHRGYRCYQGGFKVLGRGQSGKPMCRSVITVNHDPGLYVKYLGSIMVACGIVLMFWMRAYFFAPRRSVPTDTTAEGPSAGVEA